MNFSSIFRQFIILFLLSQITFTCDHDDFSSVIPPLSKQEIQLRFLQELVQARLDLMNINSNLQEIEKRIKRSQAVHAAAANEVSQCITANRMYLDEQHERSILTSVADNIITTIEKTDKEEQQEKRRIHQELQAAKSRERNTALFQRILAQPSPSKKNLHKK
ncbi:hypothetical protein KBC04_04085 [Candidatus Babeliales bacterium]|nr:hypothetical protein [Candidatus Babeliales bacterium]MBP9843324.1 hypothetical protein [Candidatus Babeliales bacterium]